MKPFIKILFIFLVIKFSVHAQKKNITNFPKYEVRAVWLTTVGGLDWPKTTDVETQKKSLIEILEDIRDRNFNTIFFQVRGRGDAMYNSEFEPWSERLTGIQGKDPGWDPLQFVIDWCHMYGIEVHAWFNTFRIRNGEKGTYGNKRHIAEIHPEWVKTYEGEMWMDPGIPAVRKYVMDVALDLIRKYNVDGIHFDFIRYPGSGFPDNETYKLYGNNKPKDEWRRENINKFVRSFYDSAISLKPMLKVGSAPIGVYKNLKDAIGWQSYSAIYQDSRQWLIEGKHDYLAPQLYWTLGTEPRDPDFAILAKDWCENSYGRHIYLGIGAYKPKVAEQLPLLIDVSRLYGAQGNSIFRYGFIKNNHNFNNRYTHPAFIPPMPWKDSIPPNPPFNLNVEELDKNTFKISWNRPKIARDGDLPRYFCVYRSQRHPVDMNNTANIIAIVPAEDTVYIDKISMPRSINYYYVVTAFDKGNNESMPAYEIKVSMPIITDIAKKVTPEINFAIHKHKKTEEIFLIYELTFDAQVNLRIFNPLNGYTQLINDLKQPAGKYIINLKETNLQKGYYTIELSVNDKIYNKNIYIN